MRNAWDRFWRWYQRHYLATLVLTTGVFLLQLFHLYWLFSDVIVTKLTGHSAFVFPRAGMFVYVLADYLEIPALVAATLLYVYELRRGVTPRAVLYVVLLNTQWIHMFWITDQVVVDTFAGHGLLAWNAVVAWVAILIDYLEVPVIVDTLRKVAKQRHGLWAPRGATWDWDAERDPACPRRAPALRSGALRSRTPPSPATGACSRSSPPPQGAGEREGTSRTGCSPAAPYYCPLAGALSRVRGVRPPGTGAGPRPRPPRAGAGHLRTQGRVHEEQLGQAGAVGRRVGAQRQ